MGIKEFPRFWFDGNQYCGWVSSEKDLQDLFKAYDGQMTPEEIIDKSTMYKERDIDYPLSDYDRFTLKYKRPEDSITLTQHFRDHKINQVLC